MRGNKKPESIKVNLFEKRKIEQQPNPEGKPRTRGPRKGKRRTECAEKKKREPTWPSRKKK